MNTLLSIGIIQSVLFIGLNLNKKRKQPQDWLLITWLGLFALHLGLILLLYLKVQLVFPLILAKVFILIHGPMLFVYTDTVFRQKIDFRHWVHLLPFGIALAISSLIGSGLVSTRFLWGYEVGLLVLKLLSFLVYPWLVWTKINRTLQRLKMEHSTDFVAKVSWIKIVGWLIFGSGVLGIIFLALSPFFKQEVYAVLDILAYVLIIILMGYYGLRLGVIYELNDQNAAKLVSLTSEHTTTYKHSPLKEEGRSDLKEQIVSFFEQETTYLESDFSLTSLSQILDVPKHHLSEVINREMHRTFYDLVNSHRITYAMKRIKSGDYQHTTLEAIGYDVGFNSKSAFFQNFKKHAGKTPRQYQQEISTD